MRQLVLPLLTLFAATAADAADAAGVQATLSAQIDQNAAASDKVKAFAKATLVPVTVDAVLVREIQAQNAKKVPLADIQKNDQAWQKAEEELPLQKECLGNATATEVRTLVKAMPAVRECFVMDDQGANVGQNELTSDYWQGDEDKWQKSFAGGKGGVDVGKLKFDKSANANLQQVSLPIIAADGTVVGAITFGLDVDKL